VVSDTALDFPQIIPHKARIFSSSAITISLDVNSYSLSSKATNFSQSLAYLITIFPEILSASKI
jgi:hypothetical protein